MSILELGVQLLYDLEIHQYYVYKNRFEIHYEFDNQAIIAYGTTEEEVIENFYSLYQEINNPE